MTGNQRARRRPHRAWFGRGRALTAAFAAGAAAVVICGCGGSGHAAANAAGTHSGATSTASRAFAFAHCMRSHGVQHYPDPSTSGAFDKAKLTTQQLAVSTSVINSAGRTCQHLYPTSHQSPDAYDHTVMTALSKFARCVRGNGVSNWPDPLAESDPGQPNTPGFPRNMPNINQNAPKVKSAMNKCQHHLAGIGYASGGYP